MKNSIWIVLDPHGEQLDICADELTAYAVKKHWDSKLFEPCRVVERVLTNRADVENVIIFTPEDLDMDDMDFMIEVRFDS